jgi:hypothetical protein
VPFGIILLWVVSIPRVLGDAQRGVGVYLSLWNGQEQLCQSYVGLQFSKGEQGYWILRIVNAVLSGEVASQYVFCLDCGQGLVVPDEVKKAMIFKGKLQPPLIGEGFFKGLNRIDRCGQGGET